MNQIALKLSFDESKLRKYADSGRSLHFGITWEFDGSVYYPDLLWEDFGVALIGSWASVIRDLSQVTGSSKLLFMEGPCFVHFTHYYETGLVELRPGDTDQVWRTTFAQFAATLVDAASTILQKLEELDIDHRERFALKQSLPILKTIGTGDNLPT